MDTLTRVSLIQPHQQDAVSLANSHIDKDVLYINRYDFSAACQPRTTDLESFEQPDSAGLILLPTPEIDQFVPTVAEQVNEAEHAWSGCFAMLDAVEYIKHENACLCMWAKYVKF